MLDVLDLMTSDWEDASGLQNHYGDWKLFADEIRQSVIENMTVIEISKRAAAKLSSVLMPADYNLKSFGLGNYPIAVQELLLKYASLVNQNPAIPLIPFYGMSFNNLAELTVDFAALYGESCGAPSLSQVMETIEKRPEETPLSIGDYSYATLWHYILYAHLFKHENYNNFDNVIEIGSGLGRTAEIIKKMHKHINYYAIELPGSAYLCHEILRARFENEFAQYQSVRELYEITLEGGADHTTNP